MRSTGADARAQKSSLTPRSSRLHAISQKAPGAEGVSGKQGGFYPMLFKSGPTSTSQQNQWETISPLPVFAPNVELGCDPSSSNTSSTQTVHPGSTNPAPT